MTDNELFLETKLKYQEIYIKMLEREIFILKGESELNLHRNESDYSIEISISLKSKLDALMALNIKLQKKLSQRERSSICPLTFEMGNNCPAPPTYQLRRVANISMGKVDPFHKSVILRWGQGKNELGNALYLDDAIPLEMDTIGYLIEKFFHEICNARIKTLKGEKVGV